MNCPSHLSLTSWSFPSWSKKSGKDRTWRHYIFRLFARWWRRAPPGQRPCGEQLVTHSTGPPLTRNTTTTARQGKGGEVTHSTHSRTHTRTHARTHAHTHAHTHARTHTRTHARTHAHTHTHTSTERLWCDVYWATISVPGQEEDIVEIVILRFWDIPLVSLYSQWNQKQFPGPIYFFLWSRWPIM